MDTAEKILNNWKSRITTRKASRKARLARQARVEYLEKQVWQAGWVATQLEIVNTPDWLDKITNQAYTLFNDLQEHGVQNVEGRDGAAMSLIYIGIIAIQTVDKGHMEKNDEIDRRRKAAYLFLKASSFFDQAANRLKNR